MACCMGLEACPCAEETTQSQKPAPAIPAGVDLKLVIANASGPPVAFVATTVAAKCLATAVSQTEFQSGYAGVPLSVAFCSHLI